jgi:hypothetical protein
MVRLAVFRLSIFPFDRPRTPDILDLRMSVSILERDWKVFRELRPVALERLCDQILAEAKSMADRPGKSAHERYLGLYKLIRDRDRDVARGFNEFSRSSAMGQICIMHQMGLFTGEELRRFSPETLHFVEMVGPIPEA